MTQASDPNTSTTYRGLLQTVANDIVSTVLKKDKEYGASWKRRGGVGAYMMLVRKSDRLEEQVKKFHYDVFRLLLTDADASEDDADASEDAEDTLRDQIAYGLLILAEIQTRKGMTK